MLATPPPDPRSLPSGLIAAIVKAASLLRIGVTVSANEAGERRYAYVSDAAARLLGSEPQELLAQPAARSFAPQDAERIERWRERRAQGGEAANFIECDLVREDRSTVSVRMASSAREVEGREILVDFLFDTGDRGRAERLEKSQARFQRLLEVAPEGVLIVVPERVVYANPALVKMLGYADVRQVTTVPLAELVHPDDFQRVHDSIQKLLQTATSLGPFEIRARKHDGTYLAIETVSMVADWNGTPAVLAISRDLDQRRRQKAQSIQADRLTALGTLAAGVAHEINNPLAYVLLNLQYLMREVPKFNGDPARLALFVDRLNEARHGTERVSTIVRDLRAFARTDLEGKSSVDLRRVLAAALRVASPEIEGRARVVEEYEPVPPVEGNAARLEQVFLNLLINAAQAFPERSDLNEIHVRLRSQGERVIVAVGDNGAGIEPALQSRVFDPFFTTKPGVGTGLGLPICHSIVTRLGGDIEVTSTVGVGTVFRVSLPARAPSLARRVVTPPPDAQHARRARVLVVDDELPLASMLSRVLADEHDVFIATSAREALAQLRDEPEFDVVLCDLLMPAMTGMDLYRELESQHGGVAERIIFMTGGAFTPKAAEFLASVPNPRLEKPFDLNQVRQLVRRLSRPRCEIRTSR